MKSGPHAMRLALGCLLTAMSAPALAQTVANPGFESGSLAGWTVSSSQPGAVSVVGSTRTTRPYAGSYSLSVTSGSSHTTDVSQTVSGLTAGQYLLTAMVKNPTGGQTSALIYAKNCGGAVRQTSTPLNTGYSKVVVRGIQVSGGSCTIGFSTQAGANQGVQIDDFALTPDNSPAYSMMLGGDMSRLTWLEQLGGKLYENGVEKEAMQLMADNGFNYVRLRAYNDPGNPNFYPSSAMPAGIQNTADILDLARRASAKGMKIQLSLNYSDWWADGCTQDVPHEWVGMTQAQITQALYDYTYDIVNRMKAQGTPPESVSLGNQISCGILLNPGSYGSFTATDWSKLGPLLTAGSNAVKAASPTTKVMIHLQSPYDVSWFFPEAIKNVPFDVMGLSWYPYYEKVRGARDMDTLPELLTTLNSIAAQYNKDIVIMETGVNWSSQLSTGGPGQLRNNGNVGYPQTPEGQRDYMYDIINVCKSVDNGRCKGILYWDPISVNQPGFGWIVGGPNQVDNYTLFDWNHEALPSLKQAFKNNK